jgi:hypothetical protein
LHHEGKNRAMPRFLRPYWHPDESENPFNGLWSLVIKNVFYCRAVSGNSSFLPLIKIIPKLSRMRLFHLIIFFAIQFPLLAQNRDFDTIKIKLVSGKESIKAATIFIKDSNPPSGTTTDLNGVATLIIPKELDKTVINFLGPYIELKIIRPVDSIFFDIRSKRAIYYFDKKRIKTQKQIVN